VLENLERRLVLNATIDPVVDGDNVYLDWFGDTTADNVTVTYDPNTLFFTYSDPGHTIDVTPDPGVVDIVNNDSSSVSIAPIAPYNIYALDFTSPFGGNTYNIQSNYGTVTGGVNFIGAPVLLSPDTINLGNPTTGLGAGFPEVFTEYPPLESPVVNVLDAGDTSAATFSISGSQISFSGQPANPILNYSDSILSSLTVDGGSGGNTFDVSGTPANATTTLNTGTGNDTTDVTATGTGSTLDINGQSGSDTVTLGGSTTAPLGMQGLAGTINVGNAFGFTALTLDDSQDPDAQTVQISDDGTGGQVTGISPATIAYVDADISSLTINGGSGGNTFNVNGTLADAFIVPTLTTLNTGTGNDVTNVLATNSGSTLDINGQDGTDTVTLGGSPEGPLGMQGLSGTISVGNAEGSTALTLDDSEDTTGQTATMTDNGTTGTVTGLSPATINYTDAGISSLTVNGGSGGNTFTVDGTLVNPAFNPTPETLNTGAGDDTTSVQATSAGSTLTVNGGAGQNTLNYDAGGLTPTVSAGLLPGEVVISLDGHGTVDALNNQSIDITDVGPLTITPGPAVTINSVEGASDVDALVGTFTMPITPIIASPPGFPAGDFTASIDWGDPSPDPGAGTITQDASDPSIYYVTGTHTFADPGTYTVAIPAINFAGGTITDMVGGTSVSVTFGPAGPTAGTLATADVSDGDLAVSAFPVVGTEGLPIAAGPIATFIGAGAADPVGDYTATISIVNAAGATVVSVPAASITQIGTADQFTVNAPAFTLPDAGTYQVTVTVTDSAGPEPFSASGAALAVIAAAPLTAGDPIALTPNTGVPLSTGTVVGTFTDADPTAPVSDFTATIDWGDGTPNSIATITQPEGAGTTFDVTDGHIFPHPGTYSYTIIVTGGGGSKLTLTGSATVTDLAVTGATDSFTAIAGQNTGFFVLATFTDPNILATVASENATLAAGGWGDGTPTSAGVTLVVQQIGVTPLTSETDPGGPIFEVLGSHTYTDVTPQGTPDPLSVIITTLGGTTTTLTSPPGGGVTVVDGGGSDGPDGGTLTGQLNPASDSGLSTDTPNLTNVAQPTFSGTSAVFAQVSLFATPTSGGTPIAIGTVTAGANGSWSLTSGVALADGGYNITATALSQSGGSTQGPVTIDSNLVIDTAGPVITSVFFNRLNGEVDYVIQDPSPGAGLDIATLLDSSNYLLTKVLANKAYPGKWIVTNITATPGSAPNSEDVAVQFNGGAEIRGGYYLFTILASSNGNPGVQDLAENELDGAFYGTFPSGSGKSGTDFVAELSGYGMKIFAPQTVIGTASAANGGAGSSQDGDWTPVVPRGGGSIFGADPTNLHNQHAAKARKTARTAEAHQAAKPSSRVVVQGQSMAKEPKLVTGIHPKGPHRR
jgi:Bacterial Ig-like domain